MHQEDNHTATSHILSTRQQKPDENVVNRKRAPAICEHPFARRTLEQVLKGELRDSSVACRLDLSKRSIADRVVWVVEIRMVEQVEELAPKLNRSMIADLKLLEERHVDVHETGTVE